MWTMRKFKMTYVALILFPLASHHGADLIARHSPWIRVCPNQPPLVHLGLERAPAPGRLFTSSSFCLEHCRVRYPRGLLPTFFMGHYSNVTFPLSLSRPDLFIFNGLSQKQTMRQWVQVIFSGGAHRKHSGVAGSWDRGGWKALVSERPPLTTPGGPLRSDVDHAPLSCHAQEQGSWGCPSPLFLNYLRIASGGFSFLNIFAEQHWRLRWNVVAWMGRVMEGTGDLRGGLRKHKWRAVSLCSCYLLSWPDLCLPRPSSRVEGLTHWVAVFGDRALG